MYHHYPLWKGGISWLLKCHCSLDDLFHILLSLQIKSIEFRERFVMYTKSVLTYFLFCSIFQLFAWSSFWTFDCHFLYYYLHIWNNNDTMLNFISENFAIHIKEISFKCKVRFEYQKNLIIILWRTRAIESQNFSTCKMYFELIL